MEGLLEGEMDGRDDDDGLDEPGDLSRRVSRSEAA